MQTAPELSEQDMLAFLARHQLPLAYQSTAEEFFLPLARRLPEFRAPGGPLFLGINGAQGTGKSTLADFLALATASFYNWNVAVLSIDDFYYTREERTALATDVHPLLMTRGVPGTHDMKMLANSLDHLRQAGPDEEVLLPRFDKAIDDRGDASQWPVVTGPIDLIILEGWCVGSQRVAQGTLAEPINDLERNEDKNGVWRRYANDQLGGDYLSIFAQLNSLILLRAPGFDAIFRWRLEQEQKLAAKSYADSAGLMNEKEIARFIQFYERLTRANLDSLSTTANIVYHLNESHSVTSCQSAGSH